MDGCREVVSLEASGGCESGRSVNWVMKKQNYGLESDRQVLDG